MPKRKVYVVEPSRNGWMTSEWGGSARATYNTKEEAIRTATWLARQHPAGQVRVKNLDGTVEELNFVTESSR